MWYNWNSLAGEKGATAGEDWPSKSTSGQDKEVKKIKVNTTVGPNTKRSVQPLLRSKEQCLGALAANSGKARASVAIKALARKLLCGFTG